MVINSFKYPLLLNTEEVELPPTYGRDVRSRSLHRRSVRPCLCSDLIRQFEQIFFLKHCSQCLERVVDGADEENWSAIGHIVLDFLTG